MTTVAIEAHDRRTMADTQLETALSLYFEGRDYYSVITLAGAADETFGQILADRGMENQLETIKKNVAAIYKWATGEDRDPSWVAQRANMARNALKHWSPGQPMIVHFDVLEEARDMLDRAITNLWRLGGVPSPAAARFINEKRAPV
jgi:hypothetical protein